MGHLLESAVFMALQVVSELWMAQLSFVRRREAPYRKIDFIMERDRRRLAIEVKLSHSVSYTDARSIVWMMSEDSQWWAASSSMEGRTSDSLLTISSPCPGRCYRKH